MARSLNQVMLIGNLTRDPELRYTPQGTAVCTFSIATNRQWKTDSGDTKDEAEFHKIIAWDKLGEICSQMLKKGSKVYVDGRIQSRRWTGQDGVNRKDFEIVISNMILLGGYGGGSASDNQSDDLEFPDDFDQDVQQAPSKQEKKSKKKEKVTKKKKKVAEEEIEEDDIPF